MDNRKVHWVILKAEPWICKDAFGITRSNKARVLKSPSTLVNGKPYPPENTTKSLKELATSQFNWSLIEVYKVVVDLVL